VLAFSGFGTRSTSATSITNRTSQRFTPWPSALAIWRAGTRLPRMIPWVSEAPTIRVSIPRSSQKAAACSGVMPSRLASRTDVSLTLLLLAGL